MPILRFSQQDRLRNERAIANRTLGRLGVLSEDDPPAPITPASLITNSSPSSISGQIGELPYAEVRRGEERINKFREAANVAQRFLANPIAGSLLARIGIAFDPSPGSAGRTLGEFAIENNQQRIDAANYEAIQRGEEPPYPSGGAISVPQIRQQILSEEQARVGIDRTVTATEGDRLQQQIQTFNLEIARAREEAVPASDIASLELELLTRQVEYASLRPDLEIQSAIARNTIGVINATLQFAGNVRLAGAQTANVTYDLLRTDRNTISQAEEFLGNPVNALPVIEYLKSFSLRDKEYNTLRSVLSNDNLYSLYIDAQRIRSLQTEEEKRKVINQSLNNLYNKVPNDKQNERLLKSFKIVGSSILRDASFFATHANVIQAQKSAILRANELTKRLNEAGSVDASPEEIQSYLNILSLTNQRIRNLR